RGARRQRLGFGLARGREHDERAAGLLLAIEKRAGEDQPVAEVLEMREMRRAHLEAVVEPAGPILGNHGEEHVYSSRLSGRAISVATISSMPALPASSRFTASISGASTPSRRASACATGAVATPSASPAPCALISSTLCPCPSAMPKR